jgi:hypothetical protein
VASIQVPSEEEGSKGEDEKIRLPSRASRFILQALYVLVTEWNRIGGYSLEKVNTASFQLYWILKIVFSLV